MGRREGRKHALSLLRSAYELSKVVTLGPESSQSRTASFLGGTLNCTTHNQIPANDLQISMDQIGIHSGRCCDVEWPIRSGESEVAAEVRAEGMGLQSILNDFCLCGHVAIKSDATAAIAMVHRLGLEKSDVKQLETCGCNTMLVQGKFEFPKCQDWRLQAMHKPSILGQTHCRATRKACNWVPVVDDGKS